MDMPTAFLGAAIFDGRSLLLDHALLVEGQDIIDLMPAGELPLEVEPFDLGGGTLAPGFVDLRAVDDTGAVFGATPDGESLRRFADARARSGVTAILPTLVSDRPASIGRAVATAEMAVANGVPGIAGLHIVFAPAPPQSGARSKPMTAADLDQLCAAAAALPALMLTVAHESVTPGEVAALSGAGILVSLGRGWTDAAALRAAVAAGARCVTPSFDVDDPADACGVPDDGAIATGLSAGSVLADHCGVAAALTAGHRAGPVFLLGDVSAGSDLADAARDLIYEHGLRPAEALTMVTSLPAALAGVGARHGRLATGRMADFLHLDASGRLNAVWRGGVPV
ncbi:amidohydrolase family protein [Tropicimonas sp. IMCC6043]|uniref:amidohydrolase family protein n=1 Tax=Tropicimonas sp. IMCC6043 TaxID=2510645 RepID=UPI00101DAE8A|nr:amidohydrolase family protein [Tropicimonas sp. IMCC6043]RYH08937.1 hypothetical protein EU800_14490 [Tropicimonas sp. IMCC6043]